VKLKICKMVHVDNTRWDWLLDFGSKLIIVSLLELCLLSYDSLMYYLTFKWRLRSSTLFCRTSFIHMTTFTSHRINILCIKFKIMSRPSWQQHCSPNHMWTSPFYSLMEKTCMTTSFHWERRFGPIKLV
jgi:hypothetical protein